MFCALVGPDGAGKSHLAQRIAELVANSGRTDVVVVAKDAPFDGASLVDARLAALHHLTWSYPNEEEVWLYSREYWLYQLMSWFTLFFEQRIEPALKNGAIVITDGWHFKHHARFRLAPDPELVRLADELFGRLIQPDLVLWLDTPAEIAAARKSGTSKPSEHGAFETGTASLDPALMTSYQGDVGREIQQILAGYPGTAVRIKHTMTPAGALALIEHVRSTRNG